MLPVKGRTAPFKNCFLIMFKSLLSRKQAQTSDSSQLSTHELLLWTRPHRILRVQWNGMSELPTKHLTLGGCKRQSRFLTVLAAAAQIKVSSPVSPEAPPPNLHILAYFLVIFSVCQ